MQTIETVLDEQPRACVARLLSLRALECMQNGHLDDAEYAAQQLASLGENPPSDLFYAARLFSHLLSHLSKDGKKSEQADRYAEKAIEYLNHAIEAGYSGLASISTDHHFKRLHVYDSFWDLTGMDCPVSTDDVKPVVGQSAKSLTIVFDYGIGACSSVTGRVEYNPIWHVSKLIDEVYFMMDGEVPAYTYARRWVLIDEANGHEVENVPNGKLPAQGSLRGSTLRVTLLNDRFE